MLTPNNPKSKGGVLGDLLDWVLNKVQAVAEAMINFAIDTMSAIVTSIFDSINSFSDDKLQTMEPPSDPNQTKGDVVDADNRLYQLYITNLSDQQLKGGFSAWIFGVVIYWTYHLSKWMSYLKMARYEQDKQAMADVTPERPDMLSVINNTYREREGDYWPERNELYQKQLGFSDDIWNYIKHGQQPILSLSEAMERSRRETVPDEEMGELDEDLIKHIRKLGYSKTDSEFLADLKWQFPSPADIVRFKVREVYYEKYAEDWQTDLEAEPGDEYYQDCAKVGLSENWAKKYWRAHWNLPSLYQGYEMLHRDVINPEQLDDLFKAQDITPGWRDKLKQISWRLLSRVDVRRMYKVGVFNTKYELKKVYGHLGYNEDDREHMAEFTIRYYEDKERDLTKSDLLGAYRDGYPAYDSEEEVISGLYDLGYDEKEAELIVARETYKKEKADWEDQIKAWKIQYVTTNLDFKSIQVLMVTHGLSANEIAVIKDKFDRAKLAETPVIARSVWDRLLAFGVTDDLKYRAEMGKRGYVGNQIDRLIEYCHNCIKVD